MLFGWSRGTREVLQHAAPQGIREAAAERLLDRLEDAGVLDEPLVGKIRRPSRKPAG